jgi:uncharacterized membrane protein YccC
VIGIGTHEAVLWGALPVSILLAAYAPRAISFAAGQARFTVVLFVLFNIIQPVGWRVGLIRVEDIAIGFAISLGVGLLFWPRGADALLREDLAAAYARAADYVVAIARQLIEGGDSDAAARAADAAIHRLDDAFRQYLAERSATEVNVEDVAALVGGAARVRRAAQSLASLGRMADGDTRLGRCGENQPLASRGAPRRARTRRTRSSLIRIPAVKPGSDEAPHMNDRTPWLPAAPGFDFFARPA